MARKDRSPKPEREFPSNGGISKRRLTSIIIIVVALLGLVAFGLIYRNVSEDKDRVNGFKQNDFGQKGDTVLTPSESTENLSYFEFKTRNDNQGKYLVNLPDGDRFLTVKIIGKIDDFESDISEYLKARRPEMDQIINRQLASLETESAYDPATLKELKTDLLEKLNTVFSEEFLKRYPGPGKPIKEILITDFIVN